MVDAKFPSGGFRRGLRIGSRKRLASVFTYLRNTFSRTESRIVTAFRSFTGFGGCLRDKPSCVCLREDKARQSGLLAGFSEGLAESGGMKTGRQARLGACRKRSCSQGFLEAAGSAGPQTCQTAGPQGQEARHPCHASLA